MKASSFIAGTILFLVVTAFLLVVTALLFLEAFQKYTEQEIGEAEKERAAIPVHVTKVSSGSVEDVVYVTGFVEPSDRADVHAKIPMPGKLIEAKVKKGDRVRKDQVLATVDRDEVGAIYLAYGVKAPLSGIVAEINDDRGAIITPQIPVGVIINIDKVKVKTSLIESDLGRVAEGASARVRVDAYPDRVFNGTLTRIEPVLDSFSHTAPVEITITNRDHALLPGMFARIEIVADMRSSVPVLPGNAIMKRQGRDYAFVYNEEEGRIYLTELKLGYHDLERFEIVEGAELDDIVVDQNLVILKDRIGVNIMNPEDLGLDLEQ